MSVTCLWKLPAGSDIVIFFVELCDNIHNISEAEVVQTDYDGVEKIKRMMGTGN